MGPLRRFTSRRRAGLVLLCAGLLVASAAGASAGEHAGTPLLPPPTGLRGGPKLDSALVRVARSSRRGAGAALGSARSQALELSGRKVRVTVSPKPGRAKAVRAVVRSGGGSISGEAGGLIDADVWPGALARLAGAAAVAEVRTPARPVLEDAGAADATAAATTDEGVAVTDANVWQAAGYDGTGVKVAIVDGGFYGYTALLGTGLPASVTAIDHCSGDIVTPPANGGTEHGTGVAEIVHQMAPGVQLYLICVDSVVGLAQAEQDAVAAGVKVINHSVGWFNTSRGDGSGLPGTPDAIAADARAHGILWVNASGDATQHWSGNFTPTSIQPTYNDFGSGDRLDTVRIPAGGEICAALKWDAWPTTNLDYDLLLYDESDPMHPVAVAGSTDDQSTTVGSPTEEFCYDNAGPTRNFGIAIYRYSATTTPRFDLFVFGDAEPQYQVPAGSMIEPATSPNVLAVGANCWRSNHYSSAIEFYSARGPTIDGRTKPELAAPDATSSSVYGANAGNCVSGFNGTSAATPHVAGAAALLLQRTPTLTPAGVEGALEETALSHRFADAADSTLGAGNLWLGGLTTTGSVALSFSEDGNRTDIWSMNEDATGIRRLAPAQSAFAGFFNPSWSPDGTKLAFTSAVPGQPPWGVYTVGADGSNLTGALVDNVTPNWFNAMWTADGSGISFDDGSGMGVVNPGTHVVTNFGLTPTASWSPDGTRFAYFSNNPPHLFVANADGANAHELVTGAPGYTRETASWSPDSSKLAFVSSNSQIWIVNANGTNGHALTTGTSPQWSADGTTLLYLGNGTTLSSIRADGSGPKTVAADFPPNAVGGVAWRSQLRTAPPVSTVAPAVTGEKRVGQPLHTDTGKWVAASPASVSYGWLRCTASGGSCASIPGANDSFYRPTTADGGLTIRSVVTVTDANGAQSSTSSRTSSIPGLSTLPGSPTFVTATAGLAQATVGFVQPVSNGGTPIVLYRVTASPGGQTATGTSSPITVTGLTHQSYTFTVTATNQTGEGLPSVPSNAVTPTGPPGAPTGVVATAGDRQASVAFAAPADDGGAAISYFTATASPGGQSASSSGSPVTVAGLTNGVSYTFTVTATSAAGVGAASAPSGPVTPLGPERQHPDPPVASPRPGVPPYVSPGVRPPEPGCSVCL